MKKRPKTEDRRPAHRALSDRVERAKLQATYEEHRLRRLKARQEADCRQALLSVGRAYDRIVHANHERDYTWLPWTSEDAMAPGYDRLQILTEARQLYRISPVIRALVDGMVARIGSPQPHFHTKDDDWNSEAKEQYNQWGLEQADSAGCMTLDEMDEQIMRSMFTDGDIGEIYGRGRQIGTDTDGGPVFDLSLQLIESDRIAATQRVNIGYDTINGKGHFNGVEIDWDTGRVKGYWVGTRGIGGLLNDSRFHPSDSMALYFRRFRTDHRRGIALIAPVINAAKDLEEYLNAVRIAMKIAASYGIFIKRNGAGQFVLNESEAVEGRPWRIQQMINGKIVHLNPGEEVQQVAPEQPGPDFDPVTRLMLRLIARGAGSIYELLMADFSGMSYSSSKSVLTFVWKMQDDWQDWLIRSRKRRVYNVWVAKRMEAKLLPFNPQAFDEVSWIKTPHSGFDPLEDAEALIKLRAAAFITYEDFFNARGENWEVKLDQAAREIARIQEKAKEYKVDPVLIANTLAPGIMQTGNPAAPAPVGAGTTRRGGAQD